MAIYHKIFAQLKPYVPETLSKMIRNLVTAFLTPIMFSYQSGHFRSSLKMAAVSKTGEPLPWYTYPCIDFIKYRPFRDKSVLEFGGGQSTLWWAKSAKQVVTFEDDEQWYEAIKKVMPVNVQLFHVSGDSRESCTNEVKTVLKTENDPLFDVIVVDGLYRENMIEIARQHIAERGVIICDNSDGYGIYESFKNSDMSRVDFYGYAPGVVLPHCTSIFFRQNSFLFDAGIPIHVSAGN